MFNREQSISGFIIRLAAAATAVSIAAIIITLSMVNGFQQTVSEKVFRFWGHIRVNELQPFRSSLSEETPLRLSDTLSQAIAQTPGITHFHAFATRSVVLRTAGNFEGVLLKGVDRDFTKSPFAQKGLLAGKMIAFRDSGYSNEILLSDNVAKQLDLAVGSELQLFFLREGEDIRTRKAIVAGLYHTGIEEYDNNFAIGDLGFLQSLIQWQPNEAAGYEIWIDNAAAAESAASSLYTQLPQGIQAKPLASIYPNIFDWLAIQNQTRKIVVLIMLLVASMNLITCLLILVMERTRMIGVLSALGLSPRGLNQIFWVYSASIAGIGILSGLLLALGLLWLQQATGFIRMDEATYYVDRMPVSIKWVEVMGVVVGSFLVCLLALRIPLVFIKRISVVKALRFS